MTTPNGNGQTRTLPVVLDATVVADAMATAFTNRALADANYTTARTVIDHAAATVLDGDLQKLDGKDGRPTMSQYYHACSTVHGIRDANKQLGFRNPDDPFSAAAISRLGFDAGGGLSRALHDAGVFAAAGERPGSPAAADTRVVVPLSTALPALALTSSGFPSTPFRVDNIDTRPVVFTDVWQVYMGGLGPVPITSGNTVSYLKETVAAEGAAERAEGAAAGTSDFSTAEQKLHISSVADKIGVSEEMLADEQRARPYIDNRLGDFILDRLDTRLVSGNGTDPNLQGVVGARVAANDITVAAAVTGHDGIDALSDAVEKVKTTGGANASHILVNPTVWGTIKKAKVQAGDSAANKFDSGDYILGNPSDADFGRMLFGLPVVQTNALSDSGTAGNVWAIVGDFDTFGQLFIRQEMVIEAGWSTDDFDKFNLTIRGSIRVAAAHLRPEAFVGCSRA